MNRHYINSCLRWLANELVPFYDANDLPEELMEKIDKFYKLLNNSVDWSNLTKKDLQRLGFLNWNEDNDTGVWFIPHWLFFAIPEGMILWDKNEQPFKFFKSKAPTEVVFGCLPFGLMLSNNTEEEDAD